MRTASSRPSSRMGSPTLRTKGLPGLTDSSARVADKPGGLRKRPSGLKVPSTLDVSKDGKSDKVQQQQQDPVSRLKLLVVSVNIVN